MTEWKESTAKGSIAAPTSGQPWTGMPASGGPGSGRGRRAGLAIALVIVLVALGGGGYLFVRSRQHKPAGGNQVAAVRRAYLTWWNARVQEYLTLNPAPVKPYMTAAGYQQEQSLLAQQSNNEPFQLVAKHNLQAFVYSDGVNASVDDVWLSNSTYLSPTSHQPVGTPSNQTAEDSVSLRKVSGRWLIDTVVRLGVSEAAPGQQLSYVAETGGVPPPQPVLGQVEAAFARYEGVTAKAYLRLDASLLSEVESGAALQSDQAYLESQKAKEQPIRYQDQDNYRIGLESSTEAWIYDTVLDQSVTINPRTSKPSGPPVPTVLRATFELTKGPSGWLVVLNVQN